MTEQRTLRQLARIYNRSLPWLRHQLVTYRPWPLIHHPGPITMIIDATYFGRSFGSLVAMDAADGSVVYYAWLSGTERIVDYEVAVDTLEGLGYSIQAAVIDGRRGVREMLLAKDILVQHCHFHQLQVTTKCLTKRPKLEPNQQLRAIALSLRHSDQIGFSRQLDSWHELHGEWLKERYREESGRWRYRHARTRQAYFSLRRNLDYLFTYQLHPEAIPNTTNRLDGCFGVWKPAIKRHRGASRQLKIKILCSFFSEATDKNSN